MMNLKIKIKKVIQTDGALLQLRTIYLKKRHMIE
jgi:hypothetical protein